MKQIKAKHIHSFECPDCHYIFHFTEAPSATRLWCRVCGMLVALDDSNEIEIYDN